MRVAAFDLSSHAGVATWDGSAPAPLLEKKRILHFDRDEGVMLEAWRNWLGRFFAEHQPEAIGVEAPAMGGHSDVPTIYRQAMLRGMLCWACHIKQVPVYSIPPSTWRKTFIGFGSRPRRKSEKDAPPVDWKRLAKLRCKSLGWPFPDHNAAEAGGVLDHLVLVELKITAPWRSGTDLFLPLTEIFPDGRR